MQKKQQRIGTIQSEYFVKEEEKNSEENKGQRKLRRKKNHQ